MSANLKASYNIPGKYIPPYLHLQPELPLEFPHTGAPHCALIRGPLAVQLVDLADLRSVRPAESGERIGLSLAPDLIISMG